MMTSLKIGTFEKLRFKVIGIALVVNALVLATIFLFVKITAERLNLEESFTYIDSIIANGGKPPFPIVKMPPLLDFSEKVPHWNEDFPGRSSRFSNECEKRFDDLLLILPLKAGEGTVTLT